MSIEPRPSSQNDFGSLQGCFVEGSGEQRAREKRIRRRALLISVAVQSAILTAIILIPLFGRPPRLAFANLIPIPPYYPSRAPAQPHPTTPTTRARIAENCSTCYRPVIPNRTVTTDNTPPPEPIAGFGISDGRSGAQPSWGLNLDDARRQPQRPAEARPEIPRRVFKNYVEPAMLIQRVDPVYPSLARLIHRAGRVELHAIIATDGTIRSLQVVNGDPLFLQSALDAVRQWRYHPTILDGQPVEVETYITVVYTLQP